MLLGFSCRRSGLILMMRGGRIRGQDCQMYARIFRCHLEEPSLTSMFLSFLLSFPGLVVLCRWLCFRWNLVGRSRGHRHLSHLLHVASYPRYTRTLLFTFSTLPSTRGLTSLTPVRDHSGYPSSTCSHRRAGSANSLISWVTWGYPLFIN